MKKQTNQEATSVFGFLQANKYYKKMDNFRTQSEAEPEPVIVRKMTEQEKEKYKKVR